MTDLAPALLALDPDGLAPADRIFRHSTRPSWGHALLVGVDQSRRRFHFEDGQTRIFKEGFLHFLQPVDPSEIDVESLFARLSEGHLPGVAKSGRGSTRVRREPVLTFAEQVQVFDTLFPLGFEGAAWTDAVRAPAEGQKWLKRHADSALRLAAELLTEDRMRESLAAGQDAELLDSIVRVLKATGLVSNPNSLRPLAALEGAPRLAVVTAAVAALHDPERSDPERFGHWLLALRREAGLAPLWPVTTALAASVYPDKHVTVRHRYTELQARLFEPLAPLPNRPERAGYDTARRVGEAARAALIEAGRKPRDLLDVSAFMWHTLRPKAVELIAQQKG